MKAPGASESSIRGARAWLSRSGSRIGSLIGSLVGPLVGLVGFLAAALVLRVLLDLAVASWPVASSSGPAAPDEVLAGILAWAGVALAAWLGLGTLVALLAAAPGAIGETCERLAERITPTLVRKGVSLLVGTSLGTLVLPSGTAAGIAAARPDSTVSAPAVPDPGFASAVPTAPDPAFAPSSVPAPTSALAPDPSFTPTANSTGPAAPDPSFAPTARSTGPSTPAPDPRWLPPRPTPVHDAAVGALLVPQPRTTSAGIESVTVRRGDSLWTIAARHLGPGATDAEIAGAWPQWYAANRDVIGPDPHLIIPGQQLRPATEGSTR